MNEQLIGGDHPLHLLLQDLDITFYAGVTGGGVIHLLKHIPVFQGIDQQSSSFLSIGEYIAGFVPLGYFLASGKLACGLATTGAATKLLACGLSDAKLHNIPSVYILPDTDSATNFPGVLQDSSAFGNHIIGQLKAELPDAVFILDQNFSFAKNFLKIKSLLIKGSPIVFMLTKDTVKLRYPASSIMAEKESLRKLCDSTVFQQKVYDFILKFKESVQDKRLIIMVGEEMSRCPNAKMFTTLLSESLQAETIWSINGANSVNRHNPYGYGHIAFGGNDLALDIYQSIKQEDVVLLLGLCPDEYTTNLQKLPASSLFYVSYAPDLYGLIDNRMPHFATQDFHQIQGCLEYIMTELVSDIQKGGYNNIPSAIAAQNLNYGELPAARMGYVDMIEFYQAMDIYWPENSMAFKDVCMAYKDHQYVIPRPNDNIDFYSLYRGSAMGGVFGAAIGAKVAAPDKNIFCLTGDGCFRLFAGSLGEAASLGIVVFLLNNGTLGIVSQGLRQILPSYGEEAYHASVKPMDYCAIAEAFGWKAFKINNDLSNLPKVLKQISPEMKQSIFVELNVDPDQVLGANPRLKNL